MIRRIRTPTIFGLLLQKVLISVIVITLVAVVSMSFSSYRFVLKEKGKSCIDILKQVSDANGVNRTNMQNVMRFVYEELSVLLIQDAPVEEIQTKLFEVQTLLDKIGLDYTIDVVLNDKRTFSSESYEARDLKYLLNSYWYIKHFSGESRTSWNLYFADPEDISSYALNFAKTVFNEAGQTLGVIVLNSTQETLFRTYKQLQKESERVYILDENGIVVSHSNQNMIGNWYKVMYVFEQQYGYNTYTIENRGKHRYIVTNYHDPVSGWTFVSEQDITSLLRNYFHMLWLSLSALMLGGIFACWLAYFCIKKISRSISGMADEVRRIDVEKLEPITIREDYYEIDTLTRAFNLLIVRIQELISDIQYREQEKQKTEYDFLHAQLSPHFLHNTLLTVKSLISTGQMDEAGQMMEKFTEMLHIPTSAAIQFVTLADELHLVCNFIAIMNCRTDKTVEFLDGVSEQYRGILVPRMLLQPIVGNSFFHGFAEKEDACTITISAQLEGQMLLLRVRDNGEGIPPARIQELKKEDYTSEGRHHGVGIKNIRKRLRIIYGGRSDVRIESKEGQGTQVTLQIDGYDNPLHQGSCLHEERKRCSNP